MKLPKRHRTCKTCGKVFCYESKDVKRCQSCREATATGIRRFLPRLMADQKGTCPICNKPLPEKISAEIHVDHRWPKDLGGTDDYENLHAVHTPCNREKKASIDQEGYKVVKKILHAVVDDSRISKRGPKNDCVIILDDNDRKEICRLRLNRKKVYLGVFDETRKETRNRIGSLDDFYTFAEQIKATTQRYLADKP